jgi:hypothetical protein
MVRIGGKGMTSNRYVVLNCPCIKHYDEIELDNRCMSTQDDKLFFCENNTDCVIKQVIEKCKDKIRIYEYYDKDYALGQVECAKSILQLFDIEEINK